MRVVSMRTSRLEVASRVPWAEKSRLASRAAEPVRRNGVGIQGEPGEDRAQIVGGDLGRAFEPGTVAGGGQPASEVDLGAAGQQRRGVPDRDRAAVHGELRLGPGG